mmetsp:Transcript_14810/g.35295  ORF Transcript_14810/g.35295 Transcript_14810/m.35295 type:complete len:86 (-) Transcript_14810:38-295(-)
MMECIDGDGECFVSVCVSYVPLMDGWMDRIMVSVRSGSTRVGRRESAVPPPTTAHVRRTWACVGISSVVGADTQHMQDRSNDRFE